ncbi:hypothetical protein [Petrachloros mirabilis]
MRTLITVTCLLLTSCYSMPSLDRWLTPITPSVIPLWETYQRCMATNDAEEMTQALALLEQPTLNAAEPPRWVRWWGKHVRMQPIRTSVDPSALGAACGIRTATILAKGNRQFDARRLYRHIASHYAHPDWSYYRQQALEALGALPDHDNALAIPPTASRTSVIR